MPLLMCIPLSFSSFSPVLSFSRQLHQPPKPLVGETEIKMTPGATELGLSLRVLQVVLLAILEDGA
eukprot:5249208-Amphidinium_carterae.1